MGKDDRVILVCLICKVHLPSPICLKNKFEVLNKDDRAGTEGQIENPKSQKIRYFLALLLDQFIFIVVIFGQGSLLGGCCIVLHKYLKTMLPRYI